MKPGEDKVDVLPLKKEKGEHAHHSSQFNLNEDISFSPAVQWVKGCM